MVLTILCSDRSHPVVETLENWVSEMTRQQHLVSLEFESAYLKGGDILFLVSCNEIIRKEQREKYKQTLVLHASDLPKGRGWSPYIWAILRGEREIVVTLLEASDPVDSGDIWLKTSFTLEGHELLPEIHKKLFDAELLLMQQAVEKFETIKPVPQAGEMHKTLPMRTPADSRLDPNKTIAEQFNLLRVVDSKRYPAFFDYRGKRYLLKIEKLENE